MNVMASRLRARSLKATTSRQNSARFLETAESTWSAIPKQRPDLFKDIVGLADRCRGLSTWPAVSDIGAPRGLNNCQY